MDVTLLLAFLQAVLGVVNTGGSNQKDHALSYLSLAGALIKAGTEVNTALIDLTARVQTHAPITDDEWSLMKGRSDAAHEIIQALDTPPEDIVN